MTHIPEKEVLRYLGAADSEDEALLVQVRALCADMEKRIRPRSVYQEYPCTVTEDAVSFGSTVFPGTDLARHLRGCSALLLFSATLGTEADRMARMERARSMARGAIVHAAGAAMIEQYCDDMQETLSARYREKGLYLRPRYSPGYGDLPLARQADFFALLSLNKRLGLSLNEEFLMTPSKSVTAVIGLSAESQKSFHKCLRCGKLDCPFRREG